MDNFGAGELNVELRFLIEMKKKVKVFINRVVKEDVKIKQFIYSKEVHTIQIMLFLQKQYLAKGILKK